jgi:hypothetical protein
MSSQLLFLSTSIVVIMVSSADFAGHGRASKDRLSVRSQIAALRFRGDRHHALSARRRETSASVFDILLALGFDGCFL